MENYPVGRVNALHFVEHPPRGLNKSYPLKLLTLYSTLAPLDPFEM